MTASKRRSTISKPRCLIVPTDCEHTNRRQPKKCIGMVSWNSLHTNSLNEKSSALDGLKKVLSSRHSNVRSLVLNESLPHNAALNHERVTLGTVVAEQTASVKVLADGLGEGASVVGKEVDVGSLVTAELLLPGLHGELVVDGDNVDVVDALGLEFVGVLDVAWNLRRAGTVRRDRIKRLKRLSAITPGGWKVS